MLLAATGCVTEGAEDDQGDGDGKSDQAPGTLAPSYGMVLTSTMKLEDSRETDPAKRFSSITLRARGVVTTKADGGSVALSIKLCDITLPIVSGFQPQLDAAFVTGLRPLELTGTITDGTLTTRPAALVLGAQLADPLATAIPATSAGAFDQDGDGKPGVSITIPNHGKIFSAMRVRLDMVTPLTGAMSTGTASIGLDQAIYGDDIFFYDAVSSFAESQQFVKLISSTNSVKLRSGQTTCAVVIAP